MLRTVFFPQQLHRYVITLQFMMNLNPVWKRQLTPYTNVRPRVQKQAQHRIANPLRQSPPAMANSTAPVRLLPTVSESNLRRIQASAAAGVSD